MLSDGLQTRALGFSRRLLVISLDCFNTVKKSIKKKKVQKKVPV